MFEKSFIAICLVFARLHPVATVRSQWLASLVKRQTSLSTAKSTAQDHFVTLEVMKLKDRNMLLDQRKLDLENRLRLIAETITTNNAKIEALDQKRPH